MNGSIVTSFLIQNVFEPKILQYYCLEGHSVWENDCCLSLAQRKVVAIFLVATRPEFLVALATVSVAIFSPVHVIVATQRYIISKE